MELRIKSKESLRNTPNMKYYRGDDWYYYDSELDRSECLWLEYKTTHVVTDIEIRFNNKRYIVDGKDIHYEPFIEEVFWTNFIAKGYRKYKQFKRDLKSRCLWFIFNF